MIKKFILLVILNLPFCLSAQTPQLVPLPTPKDNDYQFFATCNHRLIVMVDTEKYSYNKEQLWATDGTPANTILLKTFAQYNNNRNRNTIFNNRLYFSAIDTILGVGLYVTDGSQAGTSLVKSGVYGQFVVLKNKMYFYGFDSVYKSQLWSCDGTDTGTHMISGINLVTPHINFRSEMAATDSLLIFSADDGIHGTSVWVSDGTAMGTHFLKNLTIYNDTPEIKSVQTSNNKIYFSEYMPLPFPYTNNGKGTDAFCVSDGTYSGTFLLNYNLGNSNGMTDFGGKSYFIGTAYSVAGSTNTSTHTGLWMTDGTVSGTKLVDDTLSFDCYNGLIPYNNKLYLGCFGPNYLKNEIWTSDGTRQGTYPLSHTTNDTTSTFIYPEDFIVNGKYTYFKGYDTVSQIVNIYYTDFLSPPHVIRYLGASGSVDLSDICEEYSIMALVDSTIFFTNIYDTALGLQIYSLQRITGIKTVSTNNNKILIFPNPSSNNFTIQFQSPDAIDWQMLVTDIIGRRVPSTNNNQNNQIAVKLEVAAGMYFIHLLNVKTNESVVKKITVVNK
jgi:ELWxxDGT repeat protein